MKNDEDLIFEKYIQLNEGQGGFGGSGYSYGIRNRLLGAMGFRGAAARAGIEKQANELMRQLKFDAPSNGFEDAEEAVNSQDKTWIKNWLSRRVGYDVDKMPADSNTLTALSSHVYDINDFLKKAIAEGRRYAASVPTAEPTSKSSSVPQQSTDLKKQHLELQQRKLEMQKAKLDELEREYNLRHLKKINDINKETDSVKPSKEKKAVSSETEEEQKAEDNVQVSPKAKAAKQEKDLKENIKGKTLHQVGLLYPTERENGISGPITKKGINNQLLDAAKGSIDPATGTIDPKEFLASLKTIRFENTSFIDCRFF